MSIAVGLLLIFLAGVMLNALFAGYETGFVSSNPIRVRYLAEEEGDPNAQRLLAYLENPDRMITVVLLGTNLALVMGAIALTRQVGPLWASIIATPVFLVFGEVAPKSVFRVHPTRLAIAFMPVIRFFDALLTPLVLPITALSRGLMWLAGNTSINIRSLITSPEDVRALVDEGAHHGAIDYEERAMIHSIMDLQTRQANEVMVPRVEIRALPETATRDELVALLKESGLTRIPIYRGAIDEIIGVVNAFNVLTDDDPDNQDIRRFIKEVMHVPDSMKLDDLLEALRDARQHMAIVTDEFGGTDGLVAMEDILEEIFGEIHDEHDKAETRIRKVGKNAFVLDARVPLGDAARAMGVTLEDEEVETIGGWLMHVTGRIPEKGEVIDHGGFRCTVLSGGRNSLSSIRIELRGAPPAPESGGA